MCHKTKPNQTSSFIQKTVSIGKAPVFSLKKSYLQFFHSWNCIWWEDSSPGTQKVSWGIYIFIQPLYPGEDVTQGQFLNS